MSEVLRNVGPEDVDSAGDLVRSLGVHNKGQQLISEVARAKPPGVTRAQSRPEDVFRTRFLDPDEVEKQVEDAFGDEVDIQRVLSARVKGKGSDPDSMQVVVLYGVESGRTGRAVVPYKGFKTSRKRYDKGVTSGAFDPFVEDDDPKELRKQLAAAKKAASVESGRGRPAGTPVAAAGAAIGAADPGAAAALAEEKVDDIKQRIPDLSEAELDALEDAEKAKSKPRKTVLDEINSIRDERSNAA